MALRDTVSASLTAPQDERGWVDVTQTAHATLTVTSRTVAPKGRAVQPLHRLVRKHTTLIGVLLALSLAMKLLMPAGFMPVVEDGRIVVSICSGTERTTAVVAIPGMARGAAESGKSDGKAELPCAFAGLSLPSLAAINPIQLAALILFILALGLAFSIQQPPTAAVRLRPPLRAPPALT